MRKSLITGAAGFIGGRLAEIVCEQAIATVALVRTWSQAARLSRLPVEMVHGDILDIHSLRRAMKGCDVVFHCAVDFRAGGKANRRSSVRGTRNVLQAALDVGVERVVFLSSIAVYGKRPRQGAVTEEEACPYTGDPYADGKIDAEEIGFRYHRNYGLPLTILRPTIVYGPFSRYWTVDTVAAIRDGRMVLVNGGTGICNCLYVDNLVEAMLLSARHPQAPGGVFNVSDPSPVTWKEFIEGHARALGDGYLPLAQMTVQEIEAARARAKRHSPSSIKQTFRLIRDPRILGALRSIPVVSRLEMAGRTAARNVLPMRAQGLLREVLSKWKGLDSQDISDSTARPLLQPHLVRLYTTSTIFSIEKASRILGYNPTVSFSEGMDRTDAWIKWARL